MTAMFLVVYFVRIKGIEHAWLVAVLSGVVTEFVLMLAGVLLLAIGKMSFFLLLVMLLPLLWTASCLFCQGFDYSRTEHVQFEDDEYYYYVTAVQRYILQNKEKEVKRITSETSSLPVQNLGEMQKEVQQKKNRKE